MFLETRRNKHKRSQNSRVEPLPSIDEVVRWVTAGYEVRIKLGGDLNSGPAFKLIEKLRMMNFGTVWEKNRRQDIEACVIRPPGQEEAVAGEQMSQLFNQFGSYA